MTKNNPITVLDGAVTLHQPAQGFRTSIDAVLLAAACPAKEGSHILDLGCGVGSSGFCALHRINNTRLTGIDIVPENIDLAQKNAETNNLTKRCVFENINMKDFQKNGFDHIICNPPFEDAGKHLHSPHDHKAKAIGHMAPENSIQDWITCAFNAVKSGGTLTMIHKAGAMQELMIALGKSWGATEIIPLFPKEGRAPKRVIIRTIKHRKSPSILHPGLILHNDDGSYTQEAENILRDGGALL